MVDRYSSECTELCHFPNDKGELVHYSDYEALEAKLAALVSECERVLQNTPLYGYNIEPRDILRQAIEAAKG